MLRFQPLVVFRNSFNPSVQLRLLVTAQSSRYVLQKAARYNAKTAAKPEVPPYISQTPVNGTTIAIKIPRNQWLAVLGSQGSFLRDLETQFGVAFTADADPDGYALQIIHPDNQVCEEVLHALEERVEGLATPHVFPLATYRLAEVLEIQRARVLAIQRRTNTNIVIDARLGAKYAACRIYTPNAAVAGRAFRQLKACIRRVAFRTFQVSEEYVRPLCALASKIELQTGTRICIIDRQQSWDPRGTRACVIHDTAVHNENGAIEQAAELLRRCIAELKEHKRVVVVDASHAFIVPCAYLRELEDFTGTTILAPDSQSPFIRIYGLEPTAINAAWDALTWRLRVYPQHTVALDLNSDEQHFLRLYLSLDGTYPVDWNGPRIHLRSPMRAAPFERLIRMHAANKLVYDVPVGDAQLIAMFATTAAVARHHAHVQRVTERANAVLDCESSRITVFGATMDASRETLTLFCESQARLIRLCFAARVPAAARAALQSSYSTKETNAAGFMFWQDSTICLHFPESFRDDGIIYVMGEDVGSVKAKAELERKVLQLARQSGSVEKVEILPRDFQTKVDASSLSIPEAKDVIEDMKAERIDVTTENEPIELVSHVIPPHLHEILAKEAGVIEYVTKTWITDGPTFQISGVLPNVDKASEMLTAAAEALEGNAQTVSIPAEHHSLLSPTLLEKVKAYTQTAILSSEISSNQTDITVYGSDAVNVELAIAMIRNFIAFQGTLLRFQIESSMLGVVTGGDLTIEGIEKATGTLITFQTDDQLSTVTVYGKDRNSVNSAVGKLTTHWDVNLNNREVCRLPVLLSDSLLNESTLYQLKQLFKVSVRVVKTRNSQDDLWFLYSDDVKALRKVRSYLADLAKGRGEVISPPLGHAF
ncbi:hypothetical protein BABINDRAFT_160490 [Babjeviella inositovora NRRL Y-12698]|uniref:K Homology domain-containing protein n=1 Tax=Babjeviella inositovora NRRL Y-12698 TaxID=984486 RepID=A0A1E3QTT3_9ASCO|nr:uncharacterized protein BABINDRAFT_160490 [Babjeviella inositovora NRRL Y-12698]ODQ81079.1 hypothetical protein BABINDRAFT_160490 [Babjeviella inositovora NRRL Y-12698]